MVGDYLETGQGRLPPGLFDAATVRLILTQHRRGEVDRSREIWLLLNYAAWHELYVRPGIPSVLG
jgi:hypothetical protein